MIRHILLIKFKPETKQSNIENVRELFDSMPTKVEGVESVEWGLNDSPEGLDQGFTHAVVMTFTDEQARQNYLPHPEHEALKTVFVPMVDDIIVFDYSM